MENKTATKFKSKFLLLAVVPLLLVGIAAAPSSMASSTTAPGVGTNPLENIAVNGTVANVGTFEGTLGIVSFAPNTANTGIAANGILNGVVRDGDGHIVQTISNEYVSDIPVSFGSGAGPAAQTCNILHLVLGPLDLNLLGLTIHLNQVVLDITAHGGPGNLLGNLLCAVAHLLDQTPAPLTQIANLLNQILGLLG